MIVDEAYADTAPAAAIPPLDVSNPSVLRMRTFSKAYGMAGVRVGYAIGEAGVIRAFDKVRNHFDVSRIAQAGAIAALGDQPYLQGVVSSIARARARIGEIATASGLAALPSATNFVAIDCGRDGAHARRVLSRPGGARRVRAHARGRPAGPVHPRERRHRRGPRDLRRGAAGGPGGRRGRPLLMGLLQASGPRRNPISRPISYSGSDMMTIVELGNRPAGRPSAVPKPSLVLLVEQAAGGDREALSALYEETSARVFGLASRILRDQSAAEDVVIDVYMQLHRGTARYDAVRGHPLAWLMMLTRSRAIDRLRADASRRRFETPAEVATLPASLESGPEEWTEAGQLRRAVSRALGKLSPEQRQLISLAYYGGFSQSEIAEKLGLPLGTVKTRIRAGMSVLRAQLQDRSAEEPA